MAALFSPSLARVQTRAQIVLSGRPVELRIASVTALTIRLTLLPLNAPQELADDGSVAARGIERVADLRELDGTRELKCGTLSVRISAPPLTAEIRNGPDLVQRLAFDAGDQPAMTFQLNQEAVFGLGEGGPQFDRRGSHDRMRNGQGGYRLATHGGRVPIPWLVGASGWAIFVHQPYGTFDLTGATGRFIPNSPAALPLDVFIVGAREPAGIMTEYARLTGFPEMPPLWSLGYQQSHRTITSREELLGVARMFREKKLPCDALIYLGTGFCPSGWNQANGSFVFNPAVFDDPPAVIRALHDQHFKVVLHAVIMARAMGGAASDGCQGKSAGEQEAGVPATRSLRGEVEEACCYWDAHRKVFALGVDGWWPDEGDALDAASRLTRIRMYWEGPQIDRPNQRPYALHRNGYAGMQRYAPFLWSGDVSGAWETLRTHIPVALNTGLTGIPFWGTDTGGFVPTKELTGELYVRWFQFSAFCPLFRSHGRAWKLRLPWGWNTGEVGPAEISGYSEATLPGPGELHNAEVEPICRKYLELRYRLLPYLYTAVRETHDTGMPIMRALWLHYPDDPAAVARGDQYLWGRDILVAPVTEKAATVRSLYLPRGFWYDFWTNENIEGGREVQRSVDLATIPLYVRAGSILPMGPVKQWTAERLDEPVTLVVYPGANGASGLYEDDGASFSYRRGDFSRLRMSWNDNRRVLSIRVAEGARAAAAREFQVRLAGEDKQRRVRFQGRPLEVKL
jgi:alpha-glucosidase/alpha-D-xyloside xylohydrolase